MALPFLSESQHGGFLACSSGEEPYIPDKESSMVIIRTTGHSLKHTALALYVWWLKQVLSIFSRAASFIITALFVAGGIVAGPAQALEPGTVIGWGFNGLGQTTIPAGLTGITAIAAGAFHSLALKSDGTVVGWGDNFYRQTTIPAGLTGVSAIAAGGSHSLALKSDGAVAGWGLNDDGQTTVPEGLKDVIAIAAGYAHSLALQ